MLLLEQCVLCRDIAGRAKRKVVKLDVIFGECLCVRVCVCAGREFRAQ